jgi:hypothetical protein
MVINNQILFDTDQDMYGFSKAISACSVILGRYRAENDIGFKLAGVDLRDFLFCGFGKGHLKTFRKFSDIWEAKVWRP